MVLAGAVALCVVEAVRVRRYAGIPGPVHLPVLGHVPWLIGVPWVRPARRSVALQRGVTQPVQVQLANWAREYGGVALV